MTVTTTANSISYVGNGVTTAFAFPYIFFVPTDLVVTLLVTATSVPVSPAPVLNGAATYDYTVTGVVSGGEYASGGTVTFNTAPLGSHTVVLVRAVPATQTVALVDNSKFPADTINAEFDKLTVLAQQSTYLTATSLQIPSYEAGLVVTAVPAATRANKLLLWDGIGNLSTLDVANIIGGAVPAGPAGGDLAGTYPSPTIKPSVNLTGSPTVNGSSIATSATVFRLLQRTVVAAPAANVNIQAIPADINDLMFTFDLTPATNAVGLFLNFYDNTGTLDTTAGHYAWALSQTFPTIASGTPPFAYGSTTIGADTSIVLSVPVAAAFVGNVDGIRGSGTVPNIRAARRKGVNFQTNYLDDGGGQIRVITGSGWRNALTSITGFRLAFTAGNVASGAFSVWGSP